MAFNDELKRSLDFLKELHKDINSADFQLKKICEKYYFDYNLVLKAIYGEIITKENSIWSWKTTIIPNLYMAGEFLNRYNFRSEDKVTETPKEISCLPLDKQAVYSALPEIFTTGEGIKIAGEYGMVARTFKRFISEKDLFTKVAHGQYQKRSNKNIKAESPVSQIKIKNVIIEDNFLSRLLRAFPDLSLNEIKFKIENI